MPKFVVTAGPTREHIDDIRYLTNGSTGRMGYAIARAAHEAGHEVALIHGPTPIVPPDGPRAVAVTSALEMRDAVRQEWTTADVLFMTAAVSDYRPEERLHGKRKKTPGPWNLKLVRNPDILRELGREKGERFLAGFALEAKRGRENARKKLLDKRLDLIVLNAPSTIGADLSDFAVLHASGGEDRYISVSKDFLALRLVSSAVKSRL